MYSVIKAPHFKYTKSTTKHGITVIPVCPVERIKVTLYNFDDQGVKHSKTCKVDEILLEVFRDLEISGLPHSMHIENSRSGNVMISSQLSMCFAVGQSIGFLIRAIKEKDYQWYKNLFIPHEKHEIIIWYSLISEPQIHLMITELTAELEGYNVKELLRRCKKEYISNNNIVSDLFNSVKYTYRADDTKLSRSVVIPSSSVEVQGTSVVALYQDTLESNNVTTPYENLDVHSDRVITISTMRGLDIHENKCFTEDPCMFVFKLTVCVMAAAVKTRDDAKVANKKKRNRERRKKRKQNIAIPKNKDVTTPVKDDSLFDWRVGAKRLELLDPVQRALEVQHILQNHDDECMMCMEKYKQVDNFREKYTQISKENEEISHVWICGHRVCDKCFKQLQQQSINTCIICK